MLRRLTALILVLAAAPLAAQAPAETFVVGKDYFAIEPAQPTATPGKVEVLEVFSYGCGACASVQPHVDAWKPRMPATAKFAYLPATFRTDFALLARGWFAADALGVAERTHKGMFDALRAGPKLLTIEDVADLYAKLDVDREQFLAAANSFAVNAKIKRVGQVLPRYGIDSTPTFVINGRWRVNGPAAGSYERLFRIIDFLIAQEAARS
jgi:thiol:disulfide interchange protein DsbA